MIDFASAYPNSRKVYEERPVPLTPDGERVTLRVPVREVALSGGEPSIRLYDTSGPQGHDVRDGLPKLRAPWIAARRATGHVGTQLYYARRGEITPEMEFIAAREGLPAEFVRAEVVVGGRRGAGVVPAGFCVVGAGAGAAAGFCVVGAAGAWAYTPIVTTPARRQLISSTFRISSIIV